MKLFSVNYTTPVGIEIFSKAQAAVNIEILESWCYTRGSGAASILSGEPSDFGEFQVVQGVAQFQGG